MRSRAQRRGSRVVNDFRSCFFFNAHDANLFVVPRAYRTPWKAIIDTADPEGNTDLVVSAGDKIALEARSVIVLCREE